MSGLIAAIASGTAAVAGSISSFSQASKQKKRMQAAEREAKKAMAEAKTRLGVNVMEGLSIQKEPYELAREASLVAGTQALQAGVEGDERGAAATAGRVFMGQQDAQGKIRAAMGQEMGDINRAVVAEEGRLKDLGMGLSLEEAAGAQLRLVTQRCCGHRLSNKDSKGSLRRRLRYTKEPHCMAVAVATL